MCSRESTGSEDEREGRGESQEVVVSGPRSWKPKGFVGTVWGLDELPQGANRSLRSE